ncbi:MAG: class I SAM-dependent methyltransferase [Candidatus Muiribacteriota bacterium]
MDGILNQDYSNKRKKKLSWKYRLIRRAYESSLEIKKNTSTTTIRLLDAGCADGSMLNYFYKFLPAYRIIYTGIEYSLNQIPLNSKHDFICGDINYMPFKKTPTFDVIVMTAVLEHIQNPEKVLLTLKKLLRAGGIIIVTMPDPKFEKIASFLKNIEESHFHNPLNLKKLKKICAGVNLKIINSRKFMITPFGFIFEKKLEKFLPDMVKMNQIFVLSKKGL